MFSFLNTLIKKNKLFDFAKKKLNLLYYSIPKKNLKTKENITILYIFLKCKILYIFTK